MAANLFILSEAGEVLIEKHWNHVVKKGRFSVDLYMEHVAKAGSRSKLPPVIEVGKYLLVHVTRFKLSFLSVVVKETPPLMVIEFLHSVIKILMSYFAKDKTLTALTVRENFSTIYQLLMEMADGGFPYNTDPSSLKILIPPPSVSKKMMEAISGQLLTGKGDSTGEAKYRGSPIPWRAAKVEHVMNEVYVDVIEKIDCIFNSSQMLVKCNVLGDLRVSCNLSGTPDLTLRFNKPALLEDCALHRSARIKIFQRDHVLSFVPPDGKFTLLSYRITGPYIKVPIYVKPEILLPRKPGGVGNRVHILVGVKGGGGNEEKTITDLAVIIPLPTETTSHSLTVNVGELKQDPKTKQVRWVIGRMPSDKNPELKGGLSFPAEFIPDTQPVVSAEFYCKDHSATGLRVDHLDIHNVSYKPFKGVRYATRSGRMQIRTG